MRAQEFTTIDEVEELDYVSKSKREGYRGPREIETLQKLYHVKQILDLGDFSIWRGHKFSVALYLIVDNHNGLAQIQLMTTERKNVLSNLSLFAAPNNKIKAADFYRILITKLNKVLVGDRQSPGSQAVWAKLAKFPDVNVHGWLNGKPVNITPADREYAYGTLKTSGDYESPENMDAVKMKLVAHKK